MTRIFARNELLEEFMKGLVINLNFLDETVYLAIDSEDFLKI